MAIGSGRLNPRLPPSGVTSQSQQYRFHVVAFRFRGKDGIGRIGKRDGILPTFLLLESGMNRKILQRERMATRGRRSASEPTQSRVKVEALPVDLPHISTDTPVIGLTGALGSGCSYLANGLAKHHKYAICSLSKPIHEYARSQGIKETTSNLQDIGDELRRQFGLAYLVGVALKETLGTPPEVGKNGGHVGIVVDGIRNVGEIQALQQMPNFYLISVQAEEEKRMNRTVGKEDRFRFKTDEEFRAADLRDRDEHKEYGQQVKECNYLSDIILINEEDVSPEADLPYGEYIDKLAFKKYVSLIEGIARGRPINERHARPEEAVMTAAYVESRRSSCLKRKVGAVITSPLGDIITAGHNEVPAGSKPCIRDAEYGRCARDVVQERFGRQIKHCPSCGKAIHLTEKCTKCGHSITEFTKRCLSAKCRATVDVEYKCVKCKRSVFVDFLPGTGPETGKLLDMCRALHAEENAILNLSKMGIHLPHTGGQAPGGAGSSDGCVLYSTTFPCNLCANKIAAVGIRKIVYAEPYPMEEAKKVFQREGVQMERFQGVKSRAFFRLYA